MISNLKLKLIGAIFIILFMPVSLADAQSGLNLISVTLADGGNVENAADIPTAPQFILQFDKNVINSTTWESNRKCFSLISTDNENIPIRVTKADDTTDFTQRQNIFIQPVHPLTPGTAYYLKISPELTAKNGVTLGGTNSEGISIAFKTKGEAAVQLPGSANEHASRDNADAGAVTDRKPKETTGKLASGITIIGVFLVAGWIVLEIFIKKQQKK